eukprot:gene19207-biopygen23470
MDLSLFCALGAPRTLRAPQPRKPREPHKHHKFHRPHETHEPRQPHMHHKPHLLHIVLLHDALVAPPVSRNFEISVDFGARWTPPAASRRHYRIWMVYGWYMVPFSTDFKCLLVPYVFAWRR